MKVMVVTDNYSEAETGNQLGWYLLADSALSNTGKPFYLPDEYGETVAAIGFAVKISRLGKSVAPKFSGRYYSEMAPAIHFRLPQFAERLRETGLPEDPSRSFDRSLMAAPFIPFDKDAGLSMKINGEEISSFRMENLKHDIDYCISSLSRLNTLKMGDVIMPGLSEEAPVREGDLIEILVDGKYAFHVKIK
ncbi:MAG: fumarylacetoacetate hydrolase family protein [Muribaculaceae bacterium]|nr:fumarylacetoacetate hydrolase family protein [Muribaculaceae bacterium]